MLLPAVLLPVLLLLPPLWLLLLPPLLLPAAVVASTGASPAHSSPSKTMVLRVRLPSVLLGAAGSTLSMFPG